MHHRCISLLFMQTSDPQKPSDHNKKHVPLCQCVPYIPTFKISLHHPFVYNGRLFVYVPFRPFVHARKPSVAFSRFGEVRTRLLPLKFRGLSRLSWSWF